MANVVLKKDFRDGQLLYGDDLNNNFQVIEAGINANEDNLQDVIHQAQESLRNELVDITTDRGWDWEEENPIGTRVSFFKGTTQQLEQYEARPGQLLYNVETGETYLEDYGERIVTGSGNTLVVSDEEPTNPGTKVWIKPNELQKVDSTEVIDSLEGNETNLAPSVRVVKNSLNQMQSDMEGKTKIEEITLLTANEGYTILAQRFFKQGNHIWGDAIIQSDEGAYSNSYRYPVIMQYAVPYGYNSFCVLTNLYYDANEIGYMYITSNNAHSLLIADTSNRGYNIAKIHLDYVINE